jgi:hypothetical protein
LTDRFSESQEGRRTATKTDGQKERQTASIGKTDRQETVLYTKDGFDQSREKPWRDEIQAESRDNKGTTG